MLISFIAAGIVLVVLIAMFLMPDPKPAKPEEWEGTCEGCGELLFTVPSEDSAIRMAPLLARHACPNGVTVVRRT